MVKRPRSKYKKMIFDKWLSRCWYCKAKTDSALEFPNGDEIWACKPCAVFHGKIKRFRSRLDKPLTSRKKEGIGLDSYVKKPQNNILGGNQDSY